MTFHLKKEEEERKQKSEGKFSPESSWHILKYLPGRMTVKHYFTLLDNSII